MTSEKKGRVLVAMSGGVDSSVCAWLLKERGYDVIGATIQTWSSGECRDEKSKGCCSLRDVDDARAVARKIGIPYYVLDLSADFKTGVIDHFVEEYLAGCTPNPCIECNNRIKFGLLLEKARELEAVSVATGHYARRGFDEETGRFFVREGRDLSKDQSYVLFGLTQDQLSQTLFPVGDLEKKEVRSIATRLGLRVSDKPDSQEICFVPSQYGDFVKSYAPDRLPGAGAIIDSEGRRIGEHGGSHLFTVGQRKRIRVTHEKPYFVTRVDAGKNEVQVGFEDELFSGEMTVARVNWQLKARLGRVEVKIRSRHDKTPAEIVSVANGEATLRFASPQKAVAPGQAAVFYDGDGVLGGGWIRRAPVSIEQRPDKSLVQV